MITLKLNIIRYIKFAIIVSSQNNLTLSQAKAGSYENNKLAQLLDEYLMVFNPGVFYLKISENLRHSVHKNWKNLNYFQKMKYKTHICIYTYDFMFYYCGRYMHHAFSKNLLKNSKKFLLLEFTFSFITKLLFTSFCKVEWFFTFSSIQGEKNLAQFLIILGFSFCCT